MSVTLMLLSELTDRFCTVLLIFHCEQWIFLLPTNQVTVGIVFVGNSQYPCLNRLLVDSIDCLHAYVKQVLEMQMNHRVLLFDCIYAMPI